MTELNVDQFSLCSSGSKARLLEDARIQVAEWSFLCRVAELSFRDEVRSSIIQWGSEESLCSSKSKGANQGGPSDQDYTWTRFRSAYMKSNTVYFISNTVRFSE
ncbi:hypothetical protein XENOCAPTIV_015740 [Xenoophorus captivus]|uniref:Uncharacterized protein n=1 Tax=Xenoophorus captivus TaxID=1517983 RepID=A0ABV0QS28_9TELE